MVMTSKQKEYPPIIPKKTDPRRLHMSRVEVEAENEKLRRKKELMKEAEDKINKELGLTDPIFRSDEPSPGNVSGESERAEDNVSGGEKYQFKRSKKAG